MFHWAAAGILFAGVSFGSVEAQELEEGKEPAEPIRLLRPLSAADSPEFSLSRLDLRLGETAMIALQLPEPAGQDQLYVHSTGGTDRLAVLSRPMILKGSRIGFVRLQGLRRGQTNFKIGHSVLEITVIDAAATETTAAQSSLAPGIVTPVAGAAVWGEFTVGVEGLLDSAGALPSEIWIENGRGKKWKAAGLEDSPVGSHYRATISVKTNDLHDGTLQPFARWSSGVIEGERIFLSAVRPDENYQFADEAENIAAHRVPRVNAQIDEERDPQPEVSDRKDASGGKAVSMVSNNPALRGKFEIRASGLYQMFVNAGGDFGGGAWPAIGIRIDDADDTIAVTRLASGALHRVPVGRPFYLEEGERVIGFHFLNDFHTQGSDRNLMLDRFELAKVDLEGAAESGLVTAVRDLFHGAEVAGPVEIRVESHWRDRGGNSARVELWLNDQPFAVQYGPKTSFRIEPANLQAGENFIHAVASLPSGESHKSPPQVLVLRGADAHKKQPAPTSEWRVTPVDPAWDPGMQQRLGDAGENNPKYQAEFLSNGESILTLPPDMQGRFEVWMDGRGDIFQGAPLASLSRVNGDEREFIGEASIRRGLHTKRLGEFECDPGKNQLALAYVNDAYEEGKGDRNLYLHALRFRLIGEVEPEVPVFEVVYPQPGSTPGETDAVVVRWFSSGEVPDFDLEVNGVPLGLRYRPALLDGGAGRVTIPWSTRELAPGKHQLRVIARRGGEISHSEPVELVVGAQPLRDGPYARALHLLDRLAFGPDPAELGELLAAGETGWLKKRIFNEDPVAVEAALAAQEVLYARRGGGNGPVVLQALHGAIEGVNPVRDRFVFWAQNHFSTWIGKTGATEKLHEHRAFFRAGILPFESLLAVSVRSPAMLVYLDQQRSFRNGLNENYARELLELHTVGVHGGYSQEDVTALAGLLTGWMIAEVSDLNGVSKDLVKEFRYDAAVSETSGHRVFGYAFDEVAQEDAFARVGVLFEMLAAHPATAAFITKKLAEHYVAAPAPERLVEDLTQEFLATRGDLKKVLYRMATHEDFLASAAVPRIAQPLDYAVRLARMSGANQTGKLQEFLAKSGTGLFDRSTPDGYPQTDASYVNSNAMLQRWNLAWEFRSDLLRRIPGDWRSPEVLATTDGRRRFLDAVSINLTGRQLSERSLQALEKMMAREESIHADLLAVLVAQMPEANLK